MQLMPSIIAAALLAGLIVRPAQAQTPAAMLESLPVPQGTELQTISDHSLIDGLPTAMATLTSSASVDAVIAFYSHAWLPNEAEGDPGSVQSSVPGWRMISRMEAGYNIVVQLHEGQSPASGFVSVLELKQRARRVGAENSSLFSNLQNLSNYQSVDGKDTSTVSVYASPVSVSETHALHRDKLRSRGWQIMADNKAKSAYVMVVSRDQARMEISVVESSDYGSVVVVNEVRSE